MSCLKYRSKDQNLIVSGLSMDYKSLRTMSAWFPHWRLWWEETPPWWRESCSQSTLLASAQMTGAFREELSTGDPWEQWWGMECGWKWWKWVDDGSCSAATDIDSGNLEIGMSSEGRKMSNCHTAVATEHVYIALCSINCHLGDASDHLGYKIPVPIVRKQKPSWSALWRL